MNESAPTSSIEAKRKSVSSELKEMAGRDQQMRKSDVWDKSIDEANTKRMKEIVAEYGWPTISAFGTQASHDAWLLIQHADDDPSFQIECLNLINSMGNGEISLIDVAYLEDRVKINTGEPQLFGTQFYTNDKGEYGPWPIEDFDNVESRRASIGLETFEEYNVRMMEKYGKNAG